jgi:hypothetical protein
LFALFSIVKKLNKGYGILAKFNPKRFKYSNTINGIVNFVDVVNSNSMEEGKEKIGDILFEYGLEKISLGELKLIYDGLDSFYNGTMEGNREMAIIDRYELLTIINEHDTSPGTSWRKQADYYQDQYDIHKDNYYKAYYNENGAYPTDWAK